MYKKFYGFQEKPFKLVPDPRFLYMSEVHQSAIFHLQYGLEDRSGFVVITGAVGSGKTLLLRYLLNALPRSVQVARVINTNFNAKELLEHILNEFGVESHGETKPKMLSLLSQLLLQAYSERREALLLIDEAQNLSIDAMEELRMVSNLETNTEKLIQIVMVGQPQLRYKLNLPDLEQLKQRVTVQYNLSPLSEKDTFGYVNHRLAVACGDPIEIFTPEALSKIHEYSGGIPRLINVVSDASLRLGYVEEKKVIDETVVDDVILELKEAEGPEDVQVGTKEGKSASLDLHLIELNRNFQTLYEQMQKFYLQKEENDRLVYERLLNVNQEVQTKDNLSTLHERERMVFEKESEINRKLSEVSKRLDEINTLKEGLEDKQMEVQVKVDEADLHLRTLQQREESLDRGSRKVPVLASSDEKTFQKKLVQLDGVQKRLLTREEELNQKMDGLKKLIHELQNKKELLDSLGREPAKKQMNEHKVKKASGRRFNSLVRKILKET
jgi:general secretion pathway protein A